MYKTSKVGTYKWNLKRIIHLKKLTRAVSSYTWTFFKSSDLPPVLLMHTDLQIHVAVDTI